jgi:hypothetical protein
MPALSPARRRLGALAVALLLDAVMLAEEGCPG